MKSRWTLDGFALDWLLAHPYYIPEEWKGKYVFFWRAVYEHPIQGLCVRFLYWNGLEWVSFYYALDNGFREQEPAAIVA